MSRRTSAYSALARFWVVAFFVSLPFALPAVIAGVFSLLFVAIVAFGATILFNGFQWIAHRLVFWGLFGDDQDYKAFRASGGDPWFHLGCPPPFNNDSNQRRMTGSDEPASECVCRKCGSSMADPHKSCRACGFGRWRCGQCGSVVRGQFARCSQCGNHPRRKRGTP